ncbi:MAG: OmpA family protein [Proteobacteria bacterium]|nr:OmpA family protein [Pseudomonadota bacterium]MBU1708833.1 OmpA family protein [Pseudomonadota bacterium]
MRKSRKYLKFCLSAVLLFSILFGGTIVLGEEQAQETPMTMEEEFLLSASADALRSFIEKYKAGELSFLAVQKLAQPYLENRDWDGAINIYREYKKNFPKMSRSFNQIISLLEAPEEELVVKNLGPKINSERDDFHPVISADGKKMYFARNEGLYQGGEDVFVSLFDGEQWTEPINFEKPVSTRRHETPLSISADGNLLLLYGNYPGSFGKGDIFYCEKNGGCWGEPQHYPAPINSEYFDGNAHLSADGQAILFTSTRPGGEGDFHPKGEFFHGGFFGNSDIYVYAKNEQGNLEAINLGKTINTPYSEYSPFLHPDGKTLYFSSNGHDGLGGLDVFKSTRLSTSSWTKWSQPVNLGKEINGPGNDWGYQVTTDGQLSYFSVSGRADGYGGNDIYSIGLPEEVKPDPVTTIAGIVSDPNGTPLAVDIKWNDLTLKQEAGKARSDSQTGQYFIVLPAGHLYSYYAIKEDYVGESSEIDLVGKETFTEYTNNITMYPIIQLVEEEIKIQVNNIFFEFNKWDLKEESFLELDRWVDFMMKKTDISIQVQGHTDSKGSDGYNQKLSEKRAGSVAKYLTDKGVDKSKITIKGFGESMPVASNETDEGRSQNRRVEIQFGEASVVTVN